MDAAQVRRIQYTRGHQFNSFEEFQVNYFNYRTGCLIPGTELWVGDERWLKINSLGCKGEELDPALGTIGFFGDSTMFGGGPSALNRESWPLHVEVPGYQALNAGVEGYPFARILERYQQLKQTVAFDAVVVGGTWQNLVYNKINDRLIYDKIGEKEWGAFFDQFRDARVLALATLPTALIPSCSDRGLDDLVQGRHAGALPFYGWGFWPTTAAKTAEAFDGVLRYNSFVRRYCAEQGAVLIDLFYVYRPASYEELPIMFQDPVHARHDLYPAFGACAREVLVERLPRRGSTIEASSIPATIEPVIAPSAAAAPPLQHVYPLW